jgi:hypothetical protein
VALCCGCKVSVSPEHAVDEFRQMKLFPVVVITSVAVVLEFTMLAYQWQLKSTAVGGQVVFAGGASVSVIDVVSERTTMLEKSLAGIG